MKSKGKTRAILAFMTILILLGLFRTVYIVDASPEVVVYVDPSLTIADQGTTFDIYIIASDVVDLFLTEIYLSWDPPLLYTDTDSINFGDVAPFLDYIWMEEVDNDEGWLHVVVGRPLMVTEGLSGTVQIAKITFLVKAEGSSDLHFYDNPATVDIEPRLLAPGTDPSPGAPLLDIEHTPVDGYFSNVPVVEVGWIEGTVTTPTLVL